MPRDTHCASVALRDAAHATPQWREKARGKHWCPGNALLIITTTIRVELLAPFKGRPTEYAALVEVELEINVVNSKGQW